LKFLADENADLQIVVALRNSGHRVEFIASDSPGIRDDQVLHKADKVQSIILAADKGFGDKIFRHRLASNGIINRGIK